MGVFGVDADAVVGDRDDPTSVLRARIKSHQGRVLTAELQGIGDEILQQLVERRLMAEDPRQRFGFHPAAAVVDGGSQTGQHRHAATVSRSTGARGRLDRPSVEYSSRLSIRAKPRPRMRSEASTNSMPLAIELLAVEIPNQLDVALHAGQRCLEVMGDHGDETFQFLLFLAKLAGQRHFVDGVGDGAIESFDGNHSPAPRKSLAI